MLTGRVPWEVGIPQSCCSGVVTAAIFPCCTLAGPRYCPTSACCSCCRRPQSVPKYLYDVRSDSEALQQEYGVRMRGVVDLQLADVAVRQAGGEAGQWVEGLVKALFRALGKGAREAGGGSSRSGDEGEGTVGGGAGGGAGSGFSAARLAADLSEATAVARRYHESNNTQVRVVQRGRGYGTA